jgi:hypothetical protein
LRPWGGYRNLVAVVESKLKSDKGGTQRSRDQQNNDRRLGRNFRRMIDADVLLSELETTLAKTRGIAECWNTLRAFSNEFRFCGIRMSVNGTVFEDLATQADGRCWQLRIPLTGSDYINFFRDSDSEMSPLILNAFVNAVERGLAGVLAAGKELYCVPKTHNVNAWPTAVHTSPI